MQFVSIVPIPCKRRFSVSTGIERQDSDAADAISLPHFLISKKQGCGFREVYVHRVELRVGSTSIHHRFIPQKKTDGFLGDKNTTDKNFQKNFPTFLERPSLAGLRSLSIFCSARSTAPPIRSLGKSIQLPRVGTRVHGMLSLGRLPSFLVGSYNIFFASTSCVPWPSAKENGTIRFAAAWTANANCAAPIARLLVRAKSQGQDVAPDRQSHISRGPRLIPTTTQGNVPQPGRLAPRSGWMRHHRRHDLKTLVTS